MSNAKQKLFVVIVLILVLLFGVGQFFAGSLNTGTQQAANPTTPVTQPTQVVAYVPQPLASSTPVKKGSCFASSIAAPYRTDAWRCTVGNAISDPCFVIPSDSGQELACGANPAAIGTSTVFTLQLTKPLPAASTSTQPIPSNWAWLVQLADGTICTPFTGTLPFTAAGDVAKYSCNGGVGESMIFGDLNDASATWTAEVGSLSTSTKVFPPIITVSSTVPVFAVWQ